MMTSSLPSGDGTSTGTGPSSTLDEDALPSTGNEPDTARTAAGEEQASAAPDTSVASDTAPSPDAEAVPDGAGAPDGDGARAAAAGAPTRGSSADDTDDADRAEVATSGGSAVTAAGPDSRTAPADHDAPGDSGTPDATAAAAPAAPDAAGPHPGDTSTAEGAVEGLNPAEAQDDLDPDSHRRPAEKVELDGPALENDEMRRATEDLQSSQDAIAEAKEHAADVRRQTLPGTSPTGL